ncbi:hypothetical protein Tco_0995314 [Tanacetum coccineum]
MPKRDKEGLERLGMVLGYLVDPAEAEFPKMHYMTVGEVNTRVIELVELHEHDTQDLYALLEDAQDRTILFMEEGLCFLRGLGSLSRLDWVLAVHMSFRPTGVDQVHETHSQMQQAEMAEL